MEYIVVFVLILIQGCSSGGDDNDTTNDVDPSDNDTTIEPLTFYEEQLAGEQATRAGTTTTTGGISISPVTLALTAALYERYRQ